jgi:hypothetical protein
MHVLKFLCGQPPSSVEAVKLRGKTPESQGSLIRQNEHQVRALVVGSFCGSRTLAGNVIKRKIDYSQYNYYDEISNDFARGTEPECGAK